MLPEVLGVNAWVRSVADRLVAHDHPVLAVPLFARTAPDFELAYEPSDLAQGRRHKDAITAIRSLAMLLRSWPGCGSDTRMLQSSGGVLLRGHAAFLAVTLPGVEQVFDFYGAGVSWMRPGGGEPSWCCCRRSRHGSPVCSAALIS